MNFGMIGALAGAGKGLLDQSAYLGKVEDEQRADATQRSYQSWLMGAREQFDIRASDRQEAATVRAEGRQQEIRRSDDAYNFGQTVERAPKVREMKVADETAQAGGKLKFESDNIESLAHNKSAMTEAGMTEAQKAEHEAKAELAIEEAASRRNDPTKGRGVRLDPLMKEQIDSLDKEIEKKAEKIDTARANGAWMSDKDGKSGTPEQRQLQTELAVLKQQRRALYEKASTRGAAAAEPSGANGDYMGYRKGAKAPAGGADTPSAAPASVSFAEARAYRAPSGREDIGDTLNSEYAKAAAGMAGATKDEDRARFANDMRNIEKEARTNKVTLSAPTAPRVPLGDDSAAAGGATTVAAAPALPPAAPPPRPASAPVSMSGASTSQPATVTTPTGTATLPRSLQQVPGARDDTPVVKTAADLVAGTDYESRVQALRQGATGGGDLNAALGATGGDAGDVVAQRIPTLKALALAAQTAQGYVATVSKSGNPRAVAQAMAQAAAAGKALDMELAKMNPQQAAKVKAALGM